MQYTRTNDINSQDANDNDDVGKETVTNKEKYLARPLPGRSLQLTTYAHAADDVHRGGVKVKTVSGQVLLLEITLPQ